MMRFIISLLALFGVVIGQPALTTTPTPAIQETSIPAKTIEVDGKTYSYVIIGPVDPQTVSLHLNLPDKHSSSELKTIHGCTQLINGGFYDTNDQPIGLFLANDIVLHEGSKNAVFNGYLYATKTGVAGINTELPDQPLAFALQTGPVLREQNKPRQLRLTTDESARRMIAAITEDQQVVFLTVYGQSTQFSGPLLEDVPEIITAINTKELLQLTAAINLDGGNHSAFHSNNQTLNELSSVGSIFCIK